MPVIKETPEYPHDQDFLDAGVIIAGPTDEAETGRRLKDTYLLTGREPVDMVRDMMGDPKLRARFLTLRPLPDPMMLRKGDLHSQREEEDGEPGIPLEIVRGVEYGTYNAAWELYKTLRLEPVAEWITEATGGPVTFTDPPETMVGEITSVFAQATVGMVPAERALKSAGMLSSFLRWTAAGGFMEFAMFDPDEPNLGELAVMLGEIDQPVLESIRTTFVDALAKEEDDDELEKRLKNMYGGMLIGGAVDGLVALFRASKLLRRTVGTAAVGLALSADTAEAGPASEIIKLLAAAGLKKAEPFYSKALKIVADSQTAVASGKQWLGTLSNAGVKKAEMAWLGLDDFLKGKERVSKEELNAFVRANQVEVRDVTKGGEPTTTGAGTFTVHGEMPPGFVVRDLQGNRIGGGESIEAAIANAGVRAGDEAIAIPSITKFGTYVLPGGENYRELLITLPVDYNAAARATSRRVDELIARRDELQAHLPSGDATGIGIAELRRQIANAETQIDLAMKESGVDRVSFTGGHFDEPNVLAHVRFNKRVDVDGKRVLFIEEIQSDWHTQGRRRGYLDPANVGKIEVFETTTMRVRAAFNTDEEARAFIREQTDRDGLDYAPHGQGILAGDPVPDAPFKKTWHELVFKRMVRYAAENDFDRIAWITGKQTQDRYDLSKYVSVVSARRHEPRIEGEDKFIVEALGKDRVEQVFNKVVGANELDELVGKDLADKIRSQSDAYKEYEGVDLQVGGEWAVNLYDKMLPSYAKKLGKKFGAGVGETKIGTAFDAGEFNTTVHSMDIPDKLRETALGEGFPLFSVGGIAAGAMAAEPEFPEAGTFGTRDEEVQVAGLFEKIIRPVVKAFKKATLPPIESILSRISVDKKSTTSLTWSEFYKDIVDDLDPIARLVKQATKETGVLKAADDPYKLARLNRGVNGKAEHFLEYSPFKYGTYENVGKSLKAILEPVGNRLNDVRAYAVAKRSIELEGRGIRTGVDQTNARLTVKNLERDIGPIFRDLVEYQDHVLAYLKDAGILSEDAVKTMREMNRDYVPFFRVMDEEKGGVLGRGMQVRDPTRKIKGSERPIVDPLESIIKNTYLFINLADRNGVGDALWRLAELHPDGDKIAKLIAPPMRVTRVTAQEAKAASPEISQLLEQYADTAGVELRAQDFAVFRPNSMVVSRDQIVVYRNGKRHLLQVDPEIADTFKALDHETAGVLVRILSVPARLLRAGAVLSPEFIARNPFRDQLSAFVFSEKGFVPFLDLAQGIFSMVRKDANFQSWLKSGGPMASLVSLDRTYLQKGIREIAGQTGIIENTINVIKSPIEALRVLSDLAERGTRLGEHMRVRGAGMTREDIMRGGFASREVTLDFQRIGAKTRAVNMLIAFFNASVQGTDKMVRSFKNHPFRTTARVGAGITLPSVLLYLHNRNEPGFKDIPQWQKDLFWLVETNDLSVEDNALKYELYRRQLSGAPMTGEDSARLNGLMGKSTWWRIPKPFELGIMFGSGAERITEWILTQDPRAFDEILETMGRAAMPGFMPTALIPPIEAWANKSLFFDRPVIPHGRENVMPEYMYSGYTTEATKALGKLIAQVPYAGETHAAAPAVIENYVRGWSGGLGMHILNAADFALRKAGVLPDPVLPTRTLADIPFVKGFVVRHPSASAESIRRFYDASDKQLMFQNTIKALKGEESYDEMLKVMGRAISEGQMLQVTGMRTSLGRMSQTIRAIYRNPDMEPNEKRQLIDMIYFQMMAMADFGNQMIDEGIAAAESAAELQRPEATIPLNLPAN